jgi:two-component system cell cycle sensor histidine kinase/response regulator CckA
MSEGARGQAGSGSPGRLAGTRRGAVAWAMPTTLLGLLGLLGWATPWRGLASIAPASIPMAPSTALALLALAGAVMLEARWPSLRRTAAVSALVLFAAGVQIVTFLTGGLPWLDATLVPHPEMHGGVPTGRISPLTASGLLLASLSLLFVGTCRRHRALGAAGGALASLVALLGAVVTVGYLYGAPLLYGGSVVPMALTTAVAVGCLGLALIGLAPSDSFPLRLLLGPSARATLLRAFLPLAPSVVIVDLFLAQFEGLNPAIHTSLEAVLSAMVVAVVVFFAAHGVGREMDRAEAERARSRQDADRLAALVQSSSDAIYARSLEGTIVAWNPSAERLFGYRADEAVSRPANMLLPLDARDELAGMLETIARGERIDPVETTRVRKDGSEVIISVSESPLRDPEGRIVGVSVIARDMTAQRRAERALLESERKLRVLFDSDIVGIQFGDMQGRILEANDEVLRMTGYTREDLRAGLRWTDLTPPEFLPHTEAAAAEARTGGACTPFEKQYIRKDGTRLWVLVGYVLLQPERERSVAFVLDIDARKQAEDAQRRSEERFARVFQSSLIAIGIAETSSGRLVDVNDRCAEFFGYPRNELVGRTVFELGLWADPTERERLVASLAPGRPASRGEAAFRRKSGEIRHALVSMEALTLSGVAEPLNMVVLVDLTERRRLESQLRESQKMEAVGRLAGGVAHDFNNLLGVILGNGELLQRQAAEAQRGKIEQILKAAESAAGLTRQLLAFGRKQVVDPRVLDLNLLLSGLQGMLGRLIGEDVELALVPGAALGHVKADPGQLAQVVMDLCENARDAMPDGGLLRVETDNVELDPGSADRHQPMPSGRYVRLTVSDTGRGIEKEVLPRIFEPFFTTKGPGKGTGLGLATVYGIVRQAGGYVWVYSEVGYGTTVKLYLPRIDEPAESAHPQEAAKLSRGSETILLVEDEPSLRMIAREILEENGYRVIDAAGGAEGLEIVRRHADPIHLLITDVVMPGMNGRALAESSTAARPQMKVLYISGYTDDVIAHHGVLEPGTAFLGKPFTAQALLRRVRDVLGFPDDRERA